MGAVGRKDEQSPLPPGADVLAEETDTLKEDPAAQFLQTSALVHHICEQGRRRLFS
ncbi:hypothetical protein PRBEI_2001690900 [Prionailurus iriomotensis]